MDRYLIADPDQGAGWTHIFSERDEQDCPVERERMLRFVYDQEEARLVHLEIQRDHRWTDPWRGEHDEVLESLQLGNPDALANPCKWRLLEVSDLPLWAEESPSALL